MELMGFGDGFCLQNEGKRTQGRLIFLALSIWWKVVLFTKKGKTGEKQAMGQGNQGPTWAS